ncbi:SMC-Scp complex subunit ScpB [Nanoarchaeota archaeon]
MADLKKKVEAVLFAAGRVVPLKELMSLTKTMDPALIKAAVAELRGEYEARDSATMVVEENDGWKITVRESVLPLVHSINPHTELSKTILETLAVIAWKQPVVQSDVIKVRTNKAYDHIAELEKLGFIAKERHGRSYAIRVTQKFKDYFDLPDDKSIKDLFKGFKDIETAVKKKAEQFDKDIPEEDKKKLESGEHIDQPDINLPTYDDELPPVEFPKDEHHVQVYTDEGHHHETVEKIGPTEPAIEESSKETGKEEEMSESSEDNESTEDTPSGKEEPEHEEKEPESDKDKVARIARELLGEDAPKKEEPVPEKSTLHPALEDFIAGEKPAEETAKSEKSKDGSDESEDESDEKDNDTTSEESDKEDAKESGSEGSSEDKSEDESDDKPKPAEAFPGQFQK